MSKHKPGDLQEYWEGDKIVLLPCKHCLPDQPCVEARGTFDPFPGTDATCFIQWKGTNVCIDIHCECGEHLHYDGSFLYFAQCSKCEAVYELGTQVRLRKLDLPRESDLVDEYVKVLD